MREKKFILCFLILAFGMCGSGSSIDVNEPVEEDIETEVNNLEATENLEETAQTETNNKSDSVSKENPAVTIENIKPIDHYGTSSHMEIVDESTLRLFYNDFGGVVVFLCSYDFDCEKHEEVIQSIFATSRGDSSEMSQYKVSFDIEKNQTFDCDFIALSNPDYYSDSDESAIDKVSKSIKSSKLTTTILGLIAVVVLVVGAAVGSLFFLPARR